MLTNLNQNKYLILVLILQLILGIKVIDHGHNWGGDFALYVDESRAIVDGRFWDFYQQNLFTVHNSHKTLAPIAEPIGAPILFAPLIALFGVNLLLLKYLMLVFYLGITILLWKLLDEFNIQTPIIKFSFILLVVSYYEFAFLLETVNSDMPFAFFTLISILYYLKYTKYGELKYLILATIFGLYSYFVRDAGAAICGAFAILGMQKVFKNEINNKTVWYFTPLVVIVCFKLITPSFNSNLMADLSSKLSFDRCVQPLIILFGNVSKNVLPLNRLYGFQSLYVIVWILIIYGVYKFINKTGTEFGKFLVLFISGYLLIHVYSGAIEERYFLIIQIIAMFGFVLAFIDILSMMKLKPFIITLILLVVSIQGAAKDLVRIKNWCFTENYTFSNEVETPEANESWNFIKTNTCRNDIVFFRKPTVLRLFTRRNSCVFMEDSIFLNRPNCSFYELTAATCGKVKNHLLKVHISKDTVFSNRNFTVCKVNVIQ
jgi:hypothetical protein